MKTIDKNITNEIIINKSRFITELIKVNNIDEVNSYLIDIKNKHKGATHYCYSYIIDNVKRFNDDGEPSGTAGMPILNVLENNNLNYILCVVIRYFGGIKLGAGGLTRAYSNSVSAALKKCLIKEYQNGYLIKINFPIQNIGNVDKLLNNVNIIGKKFDNEVIYEFEILVNEYEFYDNLLHKYINNISIKEKRWV